MFLPLRLLTFLCNYFRKPYAFFQTAQKEGFFRQPPVKYDPVLFVILVHKPFAIMYGNSHPLVIHYKYRPTSSFRVCIRQHIRTHRPSFRNTGQVAPPRQRPRTFQQQIGSIRRAFHNLVGEWQSQIQIDLEKSIS